MTDDTLKDLVLKHDNEISLLANSIQNQSKSIESLIESNTETNRRLDEISKYLAKQAVFDTKLNSMDRELTESFKRVHNRIDDLDSVQSSVAGCTSVQLLSKDVSSVTKDVNRLVEAIEKRQSDIGNIKTSLDSIPSISTVRWAIGLLVVYVVLFGSYVVTSLQEEEVQITSNTKVIESAVNDGKK